MNSTKRKIDISTALKGIVMFRICFKKDEFAYLNHLDPNRIYHISGYKPDLIIRAIKIIRPTWLSRWQFLAQDSEITKGGTKLIFQKK